MKNWIALMYWILTFTILIAGWMYDRLIPTSNAIIMGLLIFCFTLIVITADPVKK